MRTEIRPAWQFHGSTYNLASAIARVRAHQFSVRPFLNAAAEPPSPAER